MTFDIAKLVQRFQDHESSYLRSDYKEAEVRREFIEPLFKGLGWDVDNDAGYAEAYKDVVAEFSMLVGASTKQPDYSFRIGGIRRFFVEVKRPSIDLDADPDPAFQLRRYGWSAKLGVSVLTNFRQLAIYDCRVPPEAGDAPTVARLRAFRYEAFESEWNDVAQLLSKEAILQGRLDEFTTKAHKQRGVLEVDQAFLSQLEEWRVQLAGDIASNNPHLDDYELDAATQAILDRIVFLRISEDRGIEPYGQLKQLRKDRPAYDQLVELFKLADAKYNSGLFHFNDERGRPGIADRMTPTLEVSDQLVRSITRKLYYPESPYAFAVIPPEILGHIYEEFLGSHIVLEEKGVVTVTTKPDVKKAGGVVYTPSDIVRLINEKVIGPLIQDAHLSDISGRRKPRRDDPIRIVDPACGSGSFLLDAYDFLLDWYLQWYIENNPEPRTRGRDPALRVDLSGSYQLTVSERRRILTSHIYGVDVDPTAVEVTKLSLLLKVLEKENEESLGQGKLAIERALPDLGDNIASGNSLVDTDFYEQPNLLSKELVRQVNPFSWRDAFPDVFANGGFDAVVGNPPWLMAGYYLPEEALEYLRKRFRSATGKFDLYYVFLEFSRELIRVGGRFGMIVPNKLFHTRAASTLRSLLSNTRQLESVVDFGIEKVFPNVTNYSSIVVMGSDTERSSLTYERRDRDVHLLDGPFEVPKTELSSGTWTFLSNADRAFFSTMETNGRPLERIAMRFGTGVQTGADRIYVFKEGDDILKDLEPELVRPFLKGRDVRRWRRDDRNRFILFPYIEEGGRFRLLSEDELAAFPGASAYLRQHRELLAKRRWFGKSATELAGNWYGLMYVEQPRSFRNPHVLSPALAASSNFVPGNGALFATGTAGVVSIILSNDHTQEDVMYLAGVLNSSVVSHFITSQSPAYQGNYRKFSKPYIKDVPVPTIERAHKQGLAKPIADVSEGLCGLTYELDCTRLASEARRLQDQITEASRQLDQLVVAAYGLSPDEFDLPSRQSG